MKLPKHLICRELFAYTSIMHFLFEFIPIMRLIDMNSHFKIAKCALLLSSRLSDLFLKPGSYFSVNKTFSLTWKGFKKISSIASRPYSVNSYREKEKNPKTNPKNKNKQKTKYACYMWNIHRSRASVSYQ